MTRVLEDAAPPAPSAPTSGRRDDADRSAAAQDLLARKNQQLASLRQSMHRLSDRFSHELQTPLMAVEQFAGRLQSGDAGPLTTEQSQLLDTISRRVRDLSFRIDDLLDLGKHQSGLLTACRRRCGVDEIFAEVRASIDRHAGAAVRIQVATDLPDVFCDIQHATRAIVNLLLFLARLSRSSARIELSAGPQLDDVGVAITIAAPGAPRLQRDVRRIVEELCRTEARIDADDHDRDLGLAIAGELIRLNLSTLRSCDKLPGGAALGFILPAHQPTIVLNRFLSSRRHGAQSVDHVALLTASIDEIQSFNVTPLADACLQHALSETSLVLPTAGRRWLIASGCDEQELDDLIQTVDRQWDQQRDCPFERLPHIRWHIDGFWTLDGQRDGLIAAFTKFYKGAGAD